MILSLRTSFAAFAISTLSALLVTGCDGGTQTAGSPAQSSGTAAGPAAANSTVAGASNVIGQSCGSSDPDHLCLSIKWVSFTDTSGTPVATQDQAVRNVQTMNQLWAQCNIGFQIEEYQAVDPTAYNLAYGSEAQNELDQIRNTFNDGKTLLAVTTGPWGSVKNAWTAMPGGAPYGAVMEASIVDYGDGIIYAHEFGHYLGLDHVADTSDLMDAVIYTDSSKIDQSQCATARQTAQQSWAAMLRK